MVGMYGLLLGPLLLTSAFPANTSLNELRASDASNCQVLNTTTCADICVSRKEGSKRKQFTCGDWWTTSDCCNGSQGQSFTTVSVFYDCRCRCTFSSLSIRHVDVRTYDGFLNLTYHALVAIHFRLLTDTGMTGRAVGVIVANLLVAIISVVAAVIYVWYR
jgi:hypothetical protein